MNEKYFWEDFKTDSLKYKEVLEMLKAGEEIVLLDEQSNIIRAFEIDDNGMVR